MPNPIDPRKATPQAPRSLRVGSKGFARAVAAKAAGLPTPSAAEDDDEDEDDEKDPAEDAKARAEAHEALRADAETKHAAAADAYAKAKGTDSAAALMAAEDAGDAASEAHGAAKASSMKLRGADAAPPSDARRAPAAPPTAQALAGLGGAAVSEQLAIAQWAGAARELATSLGAKTPAQLLALAPELAAAFKDVPKLRAEMAKRDVRDVLAGAVHAGMPREKAFAVDKDGKLGEPLPKWLKMGATEATETCKLMGFEPGSPAARSVLIHAAPPDLNDEAGLAQRAKASGMTIEERRAAEARIAADIARDKEQTR